jgi:L-histidine N-alpha-methyltransferase
MTMSELTIDVHIGPADIADALRCDAADGLTASPKTLPPKWFYDLRGSLLFDEITRLPEYYPTRREREILDREAMSIAARSGATTLIELGSGTSEKTLLLLDALDSTGMLERFVPFDVSEQVLLDASGAINARYPSVAVHAVVGDFERHLSELPQGGNRMVAFLGGTIGNLDPAAREVFLADVAGQLDPGDTLLLGTDLVKDERRLVDAYDDAAGVTAEFNRNVLHVLNRELRADFDPDRFAHEARWNAGEAWIEMWLRATEPQVVKLPEIDLVVEFEAGEAMRTEISAKFTRERVETELTRAGFALDRWMTDAAGDFALSLAIRT